MNYRNLSPGKGFFVFRKFIIPIYMSIIMKFGGTSVANVDAINQVVGIIKKNLSRNPVVITSALANVTNLLLQAAEFIPRREPKTHIRNILNDIEIRHRNVLENFDPSIQKRIETNLTFEFSELHRTVELLIRNSEITKKELDLMASFGERMASWLLMGALLNKGISAQRIDSRELVCTDSTFGGAEVDFKKTKQKFLRIITPILKKKTVPVITGFIGRDFLGNTTTLGRGGSDYSAAIAAVCLGGKEIQIWKDIAGFMTADPRVVPAACVIPRMSFSEAAELSYFGAKLLHPRTIHPAIKNNIPVRILNTFKPNDQGTWIMEDSRETMSNGKSSTLPVRAISYKKAITVINVTSLRMLGPYGFLEELFRIFSIHRVPVDVIATSEVSVSMTIDDAMLHRGLISTLKKIGNVEVRRGHVIISLVGHGLKNDPRVEANIFDVLSLARIPTEMVSKGASSINLTFIVQEKYFKRAVRALHERFFL